MSDYKKRFVINIRCPVLIIFLSLTFSVDVFSQESHFSDSSETRPYRFSHRLGLEFGSAHVLPPAPFFADMDYTGRPLRSAVSGHLKYSFGLPAGTLGGEVFDGTYQGIGFGYYNFGDHKEFGSPVLIYLFQQSRIAKIGRKVSVGYEWNFGLSAGWNPYDHDKNPNNVIIGSRLNAYINVGVHMNWAVSERLLLTGGADFSHFSNGNTEYPNAGLNTTGIRLGTTYRISLPDPPPPNRDAAPVSVPVFSRHWSYDWVVFGSWRRKGVEFSGKQIASPHKYPVLGTYFSPMYNFGYRFRTGISLDALYDGSANVYTEDYIIGTEQKFFKPGLGEQVALGLSVKGEYVMPIFTISMGIGHHVWYHGHDFDGFYQSLALKIKTGHSSFLHIGYNLKDFNDPNYLMLGFGYRFNNKAPSLLH